MNDGDHIIWTNYHLNYEDWADDLETAYPELSEDERFYKMLELNDTNLDDERANLNIQLPQPILVIADLGLWNGRRSGFKEILSGNIVVTACTAVTTMLHGMLTAKVNCVVRIFTTMVRTTICTAPTDLG